MASRFSTQLQFGAHRFQARRWERALRCGQVCGGSAPAQGAFGRGCALSVIVFAGGVLLAVLRPVPALGDAPIVLDRASGALYVQLDGTLHPVLNLASARLIAGPVDPRPVAAIAIARAPRGPALGIPGAPGSLGPALPDHQSWSLCDGPTGVGGPVATTLFIGVDPPRSVRLDPQQALPVRSEFGASYLLVGGRRVPVDSATLVGPRRLPALLLNSIPEAIPEAVPEAVPETPPEAAPDARAVLTDRAATVALVPAIATVCVRVSDDDPVGVGVSVAVSPEFAAAAACAVLAQADGEGPALDAVCLPPGRSAFVRAAGQGGGPDYLITDSGVRFTVGDAAAARSLGLPTEPALVPWPLLAGLPVGPQLSRAQALSARDVVVG